MDFHTLLRVENAKLHEDNKALETELADIGKRLRGIPGPDGSRLDGENGLAAAVMRAHDFYEAELATAHKAIEEAVERLRRLKVDDDRIEIIDLLKGAIPKDTKGWPHKDDMRFWHPPDPKC